MNKFDTIIRYMLSILLAIVGFLISRSWSRAEAAIAQMHVEIVDMRLQMTKLESKLMTDERVRELIQLEMKK